VVAGVDGLQPAVMPIGQSATRQRRRRLPNASRGSAARSILLLIVAACGEGHAAAADSARAASVALARQDSINRAQPGYVVDSILPMENQLRRFRLGLDSVSQLQSQATSAGSLVRAFVASLERADTTALLRLAVSRAEFAWLVYPDSPLSAPPYQQAIDVAWLRYAAASSSGLARLLNRIGGRPLRLNSWRCADQPTIEGSNRIWGECAVTFAVGGAEPMTLGLFSSIIEREGRFKIMSYANAF
jgi:hypothetical protein